MEGNRDEGGGTRRRRKRRVVGNPMSRPRRSTDLSSPLFTLVAVVGALALFVAAFYLMMVVTLVLPDEHGDTAGLPLPGGGLRRSPLAPTAAGFAPLSGDKKSVGDPAATTVEYLVLSLATLGEIRIRLRPDLSPASRDYLHAMLATTQPCTRCNFYRAEKPGILQGVLTNKRVPAATQRGACPQGHEDVVNHCPAWDTQCACHGPLMERGMVAWAGGNMGPDFFIDAYAQPVKEWGTQHTVFGQIEDAGSLTIVEQIFALPVHKDGGMTYMDEVLPFTMTLERTLLSTTESAEKSRGAARPGG